MTMALAPDSPWRKARQAKTPAPPARKPPVRILGRIVVHLKPLAEREKNVDAIMNDLRPKLAGITGMRVYLQNPPAIPQGGVGVFAGDSAREALWRDLG